MGSGSGSGSDRVRVRVRVRRVRVRAATKVTRHSPATNMPAAVGPGQREVGNDLG